MKRRKYFPSLIIVIVSVLCAFTVTAPASNATAGAEPAPNTASGATSITNAPHDAEQTSNAASGAALRIYTALSYGAASIDYSYDIDVYPPYDYFLRYALPTPGPTPAATPVKTQLPAAQPPVPSPVNTSAAPANTPQPPAQQVSQPPAPKPVVIQGPQTDAQINKRLIARIESDAKISASSNTVPDIPAAAQQTGDGEAKNGDNAGAVINAGAAAGINGDAYPSGTVNPVGAINAGNSVGSDAAGNVGGTNGAGGGNGTVGGINNVNGATAPADASSGAAADAAGIAVSAATLPQAAPQVFINITNPNNIDDATNDSSDGGVQVAEIVYKSTYSICGVRDDDANPDVPIILYLTRYDVETGKYIELADIDGEARWTVGANGVFTRSIQLEEGENRLAIAACEATVIDAAKANGREITDNEIQVIKFTILYRAQSVAEKINEVLKELTIANILKEIDNS